MDYTPIDIGVTIVIGIAFVVFATVGAYDAYTQARRK